MFTQKAKAFVVLHKLTLILALVIIVVFSSGVVVYGKIAGKNNTAAGQAVNEVDLPFDPEGPYAILYPRRDGNALILNLKRTASYDSIGYELAYTSKADTVTIASNDSGDTAGGMIDRGVVGTIVTKDRKGEYEQEILFGTCSKNVCKYDQGVENGTLTLHIRKGAEAYRMVTQWHLQKPDVALGVLTSGDGHFTYRLNPNSTDLSLTKYTIINDLSGAPKLAGDKAVVGKVYGLSSPAAKDLPAGDISIELADTPPVGSRIAWFDEADNKWVELDTKIDGTTLKAGAQTGGIFTVLSPKKS